MSSTPDCLDDDVLTQWAHGLLDEATRERAVGHLDGCASCRAALSALLDSNETATVVPELERTVLRTPPGSEAVGREGPLDRGQTLGRYLVLEAVGSGAMGTVYAAYDPQLDRKVALKLLSLKLSASPLASERMIREARALARLSHPNVVAVHDAGTVGAQVFIAMQFVDGRTLKAHLAHEKPAWPEVLRLLVQAGIGLAAAHHAGLVHRDFKPDNVLVSKDGRVQVTDFGLARAHDEEPSDPRGQALSARVAANALTATGEILGTPVYMPPEQLEGRSVDHRADQFAFCVAAYEALYGSRPFGGASLARLREAMRHGPPPPPPKSQVPPRVFQAIAKGLSYEPDQRFESMDALLATLTAQPTTQGRLFALALSALVLVCVVGGVLFATRRPSCPDPEPMLSGAWDATTQNQLQRGFLASGSPIAQEAFASTRVVLDRHARQWLEMQHDACEATRVRRTQPEADWSLRRACLDRRRAELAAIVLELTKADAPMVERATPAATRLTPVEVCGDVELLKNLQQVPEAPRLRPQVEALHRRLAQADAELLARAKVPKETLEKIISDAQATGFEPVLAEARLLEGKDAIERNDWARAKQPLFDSLLAAQRTGSALLAVDALTSLVEVEQQLGHLDLAHQWADLAMATLEPHVGKEPYLEGRVLFARATLARRESKWEEALRLGERAKERFIATHGEVSEAVAAVLGLLGAVALEHGEGERALSLVRQAVEVRTQVLGPNHPKVLGQVTTLSATLKRAGQFDEGIALLERNIGAMQRLGASGNEMRLAVAWLNLGSLYRAKGDLQAADGPLRRALDTYRAMKTPPVIELSAALNNWAANLAELGHPAESEAALLESIELLKTVYPPGDLRLVPPEANLADLWREQGQFARALEAYRRLELTMRDKLTPHHPNHINALVNIGQIELELARPKKALVVLDEANGHLAHQKVPPPVEVELRWGLVRALWETGDRAKAKGELKRIDALLGQMKSPPPWAPKYRAWRAKLRV